MIVFIRQQRSHSFFISSLLVTLFSFPFEGRSQTNIPDLQWAYSFGDGEGENDLAKCVEALGDGTVVAAGEFAGFVDFDPDSSTRIISSGNTRQDVFISKHDSSGKLLWLSHISSPSTISVNDLALDGSGNILITGYYLRSADFDPSAKVEERIAFSPNDADIYLAKYSPMGALLWVNSIGGKGVDNGISLDTDSKNAVILTGAFGDTIDMDPGVGTSILTDLGGQDIFLAKYDSNGHQQWSFGMGSGLFDYGQGVAIGERDSIVLMAHFENTVDADPSASTNNITSTGRADVLLAKYTSSGQFVWASNFGSNQYDYCYDLKLGPSDQIYAAGSFQGTADFDPSSASTNRTSNGREDMYVSVYDRNGNFKWVVTAGSTSDESAEGIVVDGSGRVFVTGNFYNTVDFDPDTTTANLSASNRDIYIAAYDSSGGYLWANGIGGSGFDWGYDLSLGPDQNLFASGYFLDTADFDPSSAQHVLESVNRNSQTAYWARYHVQNGQFRKAWANQDRLGGEDVSYEVKPCPNGDIWIAGVFEGSVDLDPEKAVQEVTSFGEKDCFIARFSQNGKLRCAKSFGGLQDDFLYGLVTDENCGLATTGYFIDSMYIDSASTRLQVKGVRGFDVFVARFDSLANPLWAFGIGSASTDIGNDVSIDRQNNVLVTGYFRSSMDFDPDTSSFTLTARNRDAFFAKYGPDGSFRFAKMIGGSSNNFGYNIETGANNDIYLSGTFRNTADFDPSTGTMNLRTSGSNNVFIAKYDSSGNYIWAGGLLGNASNIVNDMVLDEQENLYLTGGFQRACDFDPGNDTLELVAPSSNYDIFVASYDSSGDLIRAFSVGSSTRFDRGNSIWIQDTLVYVAGQFGDTVDFNPGSGTDLAIATNVEDPFLAVYDTTGQLKSIAHQKIRGSAYGVCSQSDAIFLTGEFILSGDFDPDTADNVFLSSNGDEDIFFLKLRSESCETSRDSIKVSACSPFTTPSRKLLYTSGEYLDTIANAAGCDSVILIDLSILDSRDSVNVQACFSYVLPSGKDTLYKDGFYVDTLRNSRNCDSLIFISLQLLQKYDSSSIVSCDTFVLPGSQRVVRSNGTFSDTLRASNGCDSITTYFVRISRDQDTIAQSACDSLRLPGGSWIFRTGTYLDSLKNRFACDSIITVRATIFSSYRDSLQRTSCDSFVLPHSRRVIRQSGWYTDSLTSSHYCDSLITYQLKINRSDTGSLHLTSCDSVVYRTNRVFKQSGVYFDTLSTSANCDSLLYLFVSVRKSYDSTIFIQACDSFILPGSKRLITSSGVYTDSLKTRFLCDSLMRYDVNIHPSFDSLINVAVCDSFLLPGSRKWISSSGMVTDSLKTNSGCDSLIRYNLSIASSFASYDTLFGCDSVLTPSLTYWLKQSGNYSDTFKRSNGCDSIIFFNVQLSFSNRQQVNLSSCDSLFLPGNKRWVYQSGSFTDTLTNQNGCDSLIDYTLSISTSSFVRRGIQSCDSAVLPGGRKVYQSGVFMDTLVNAQGCDSIMEIHVTLGKTSTLRLNISSCDSARLQSGRWVYASGDYTDSLKGHLGCDSLIVSKVSIRRSTVTNIPIQACDSVVISGGRVIKTTAVINDTFVSASGCDSLVHYDLRIAQTSVQIRNITACDSFILPGSKQLVRNSGTYSDTFISTSACDSIIVYELLITSGALDSIEIEACDSLFLETLGWITESGRYRQNLTTTSGCDSVVLVDVSLEKLDAYLFTDSTNTRIIARTTSPEVSYLWLECKAGVLLPIPNATDSIFMPVDNGSYACELSTPSCIDTTACLDFGLLSTSKGSLEEHKVRVYPNPFRNTIEWHTEEACTVKLYSTDGKTLMEGTYEAGIHQWRVDHLPAGAYRFLVSISNEQKVYSLIKH